MYETIKFYSTWLFWYLIQTAVITLGFVLPFSYFTNSTFLYGWEWFHRELMIYFLWYFAPVFTLYVIAIIIGEWRSIKINLFKKSLENNIFNRIVFFVFISIIIGALSQVAGGCIWQLPVILDGWPGYQWRRFGHEYFSDTVLIIGYSAITFAYIYITFLYFKLMRKIKHG